MNILTSSLSCLRRLGFAKVFNIPIRQFLVEKYISRCFPTYSPQKHVIYPSSYISELLPSTVQNISWKFLQYSGRMAPEASVLRLSNGRVFGSNGAVITEEGYLLRDLSREFGNRSLHSMFSRFYLSKPKKIEGNVAVLTTAGGQTYYHWILDILPRLHLLELSGLITSIDYFVLPEIHSTYQRRSLELLNIPIQKVVQMREKSFIEATNLFIPSLPSLLGTTSTWAISFLRTKLLPKITTSRSRKIYISRRGDVKRKFQNETEIVAFMSTNGFEIVYPESLSLDDQIDMFQNASMVVAPHGSGLTNCVFSNPGTIVIELFDKNFIVPCFWTLANAVGLKYYYIASGDDMANDFSPYWENIESNVYFPIERIVTILDYVKKDIS